MVKRLLSRLLADAGYSYAGTDDPTVVDVTEDSREVEPGWLFVAIRGTSLDGGEYVADAISRGAAAVVAETTIDVDVPNIVTPNTRHALADIADTFHGHPSGKLRCFGITGTDGKTTTCYFLKSILETAGSRPGLLSTVETVVGREATLSEGRLTTQSASHLQRTLSLMVSSGNDCAVIEASSHALAQDRLRNVSLAAAAITNIGEDHIEFHTSRESYARAKWGLFDLVAPADTPHIAVNGDDEWSMHLRSELASPCLSFALNETADITARELSSLECEIRYGDESVSCFLPRGGRHNMYNALTAASLALTVGVDLSTIARGLGDAVMPAGRLEPIAAGQPFDVFIDYAHTEQAFGATLSHLQTVATGRGGSLIAVFGAAGNRDRAKRPRLAQMAAATCRVFIITNEDPFGEDAGAIIHEIQHGAPPATRGSQWFVEADRREAMEVAFAHAEPGDIVVVTGKGHERSIVTGDAVLPWSDAEIAREILSRDAALEPVLS